MAKRDKKQAVPEIYEGRIETLMGMLDDVRVLDLTSNGAGPGCGALFADHGAEVIKVETPVVGDDCHRFGPFLDGSSLAHAWTNRGKKSLTLDLKDPEGLNILKELAKTADVFMESFRPGVAKRLGISYEDIKQINPKIIYCSLSAFGQTGPYAKRPGYDIIAQAMSGIAHITGDPDGLPVISGVALGDLFGGVNMYQAIMTAMYYREKTGIGQYIDVSLVRGMIYINGQINQYAAGNNPGRIGPHNPVMAPYGVHRGKDGQCAIVAAVGQPMWEKLCEVIGHPEYKNDPDFTPISQRVKNRARVTAMIEEYFSTFDDIKDAVDKLQEAGVPACKVFDIKDVCTDPHFVGEGFIVEMPVPDDVHSQATFTTRGPIARWTVEPPVQKKAPLLGQQNIELMQSVGYTEEQAAALQQKWAHAAGKK